MDILLQYKMCSNVKWLVFFDQYVCRPLDSHTLSNSVRSSVSVFTNTINVAFVSNIVYRLYTITKMLIWQLVFVVADTSYSVELNYCVTSWIAPFSPNTLFNILLFIYDLVGFHNHKIFGIWSICAIGDPTEEFSIVLDTKYNEKPRSLRHNALQLTTFA